jgi:hypothetical protein
MKRVFIAVILLIFILVDTTALAASPRTGQTAPSNFPKVGQIVFADTASVSYYQTLKEDGFDGLFKCVAYAPFYPNPPIYAGAEWRLVERVKGNYDWTSLDNCLESARKANMWFIPEIVINVPPSWLLEEFPNSLLKNFKGITATDPDKNGAPYLLSPWFIASGNADVYLQKFINAFLTKIKKYPNVPAVIIGNFKLNVLPWKMGMDVTENDFDLWPIWDDFAKADYEKQFGSGKLPPKTWDEYYVTKNDSEKKAFRDWLVRVFCDNLKTYMHWLSSYSGWKVINASIWNNNQMPNSIFTTTTPEMVAQKQSAIVSSGVGKIIIDDDNMGDYGLEEFHLLDVQLAHGNGFLIFGEKVESENFLWQNLFPMWQRVIPDGFINLTAVYDAKWLEKFRTFYGAPSSPYPLRLFISVLKK